VRTLLSSALVLSLAGCQSEADVPEDVLTLVAILADDAPEAPEATLTVSAGEVRLEVAGELAGTWVPTPRDERWIGCPTNYTSVALEVWDLAGDAMEIAGAVIAEPALAASCGGDGVTVQPDTSSGACDERPCFEFAPQGG
jgi:hypothetical protein